MLFPFCGSVFVKGNDPVSVLCVLLSSTLLVFFPPLFSHLICSSFCWTLPCPSPFLPLFSPTAPPTTPLSSTTLYHPPPLPLLFSFLIPHAKVYHSPGRPSSHHCDKRSVSDGGQRGTCCGQCVLKWSTC